MFCSRALTIFPIALLCGNFPCATVASVAEATDHRTVTVCIDPWDDPGVMMPAQLKASTIFERVGVRIRWLDWRCPDNVIRITFATGTPPAHLPGTLAYALAPSQTITVFYDRVKRTVESWRLNYVLAHVIAHEITHILQGEERHSATGLMKREWDNRDYREMALRGLTFTEEDIARIHEGLERLAR
jgi:hypothetical protein